MAEPTFADALHSAIVERGLSLERLAYRLRVMGSPVSAATLSHWQRGRTQPERPESLRALRQLEEVLGVPAGDLGGLLDPPCPRGSRESRMLPLGHRWGHRADLAGLLSHVDTSGDQHLIRVQQHDECRVGPDRRQAVRMRQVLRASRNGPDRWVVVHYTRVPGRPLPELRALQGVRPGRVLTDPAGGLMVAELLFDRALRRGETVVTVHEYVDSAPPAFPVDNRGRAFRGAARGYLLEVSFHPAALPDGCEEYREPVDGEPVTRRLTPDRWHQVHALAQDFGPGMFGIRWWWDDRRAAAAPVEPVV